MHPKLQYLHNQTRRHFLGHASIGIGASALATMLGSEKASGAPHVINPLAAKPTHFPAKAKSIIYLHMSGSPPAQELFDYKPELVKFNGKPCPDHYLKNERFAFIKGHPKLLGTPYKFEKAPGTDILMSELLPHLKTVATDMCVVNSMYTEQFNHAPAQMLLHTGSAQFGYPSMGSWVTYGLGSENSNLPGFVVFVSGGKTPSSGKSAWGSGFVPSVYQGVQCRSKGEPILYVTDPAGMSRASRRRSLDALRDLNQKQLEASADPETRTRIAQYELAFRMQMSVPEATDLSKEPKHVMDMYGAKPGDGSFASNCVLARRLVERGVRYVQLFDWGWDAHGTGKNDDIVNQLPKQCKRTEGPIAALLKDLKQRGMLDETLIVWSGEFGRTPMNEMRNKKGFLGRDHNPHAFSVWLAGGGTKGGITYGKSDELSYHVAENKMHVHDLQATILHLMGIDHKHLSYRFQGLDHRLTSVTYPAKVQQDILA